jgi:hypothetical protein
MPLLLTQSIQAPPPPSQEDTVEDFHYIHSMLRIYLLVQLLIMITCRFAIFLGADRLHYIMTETALIDNFKSIKSIINLEIIATFIPGVLTYL